MSDRKTLTSQLKRARVELHRIWSGEPLNHTKIETLVSEVKELEKQLGIEPWTYPTD